MPTLTKISSLQRKTAIFKRISALSESEFSELWDRAFERFIANGGTILREQSENKPVDENKS